MTQTDGPEVDPAEEEPVALDAADDSAVILMDTTSRLLRPVLLVVATAGGAILLALGVKLVARLVKGEGLSRLATDGARSPA